MKKATSKVPKCADCKIEKKICRLPDGKGPVNCPTLHMAAVVEDSLSTYGGEAVKHFARNASIQEAECYVNRGQENPHERYAVKPRVQETIEFAHKMGYKRLGLAFCGGLKHEARVLSEILTAQGFEVASVVCKVGRTPKEFLDLTEAQKCSPGSFEPMCSPITQAAVLNAAQTEFNIIFGLCVGHDSLVMRHADALCTVLVAKDRVTGHNPLAAIQLYQSYYKKLKTETFGKGGFATVAVEENR